MKPLKRIEHFLGKIANDSAAKDLSPKTRYEHYLNEIAEEGGLGPVGGANVLTLYRGFKGTMPNVVGWAYKNPEWTEEYQSYAEAEIAIKNADIIKIDDEGTYYYPVLSFANDGAVAVVCTQADEGSESTSMNLYLYDSELPSDATAGR